MEPGEAVQLPAIKIVGVKEVLQSRDTVNKNVSLGSSTNQVPNTDSTHPNQTILQNIQSQSRYNSKKPNGDIILDFLGNAGRRRADERFAEDKIGEELTPDSTIWELYHEEAKDFDSEMVDGRNKNLDMMLLFAGLFSAVVTGFLIESTTMLEQDPAEASLALLLHIAQSQQRLEEGRPQPTSPLVEIPAFKAPVYARWINGLWFLSLGLSLSAALIAMLAKEWLTAFISSRPRSFYAHALLHQQRLVGWRRWYAFHVIDFLPTILHFALLLFSAGLTLYLWTLDYAIAIVIVFVVGSTAIFYIGTAFLAAKSKFCPYVTQVSKYIQVALAPTRYTQIPVTSLSAVLQALQWLAENARDNVTSDCSYQALAGIKHSPSQFGDLDITAGDDRLQLSALTNSPSHHVIISNMLQAVCERIARVLKPDNRRLSPSEGFSVSRYASALPRLATYLESNCTELYTQTWLRETPSQAAFTALDYAWTENSPYLTAEAFTLLTATEIRLTEIAASQYRSSDPLVATESIQRHGTNSPDRTISQSWTVINPIEFEIEGVPLLGLRARFSRALFRAGIELSLYADGYLSIRTDALIDLLESIRSGLTCSILNPDTLLSTHQPQSADGIPPQSFTSSLAGAGVWETIVLFDIGDSDGLLVPLMRVACLTDFTDSPELARAAARALSIAARVLVPQWINLSAEVSGNRQDPRIVEALQIASFWSEPPNKDAFDAHDLGVWNTRQLLALALVDNLCAGCRGAGMVSARALQVLYQFASQGTLGQNSSRTGALYEFHTIRRLLEYRGTQEDNTVLLKPLVQWLNIVTSPGGKTIMHAVNERYGRAFQAVLQIWVQVPSLRDEFDCTVDRILGEQMECGINPLESLDHLTILAAIGRRPEYAPVLTKLTVHLLESFLGKVPGCQDWGRLCSKVSLPHFLQLLGAALNHLSSADREHRIISDSFVCAASAFQRRIRTEAMALNVELYDRAILAMVYQDTTVLAMTCQVLRYRLVPSHTIDTLLTEYEEFMQRLDDREAWLYQPIAWLFDNSHIGNHGE